MKDMITVFSASKFYPVTGSRTWFLSSDVCLMQKFWWSLDVFEENMIRFNLFPMEKTSSTNSELPESRKRILESKINGNGHVWSMDPFFFLAQAYPCMMAMLCWRVKASFHGTCIPGVRVGGPLSARRNLWRLHPCVDVCHEHFKPL